MKWVTIKENLSRLNTAKYMFCTGLQNSYSAFVKMCLDPYGLVDLLWIRCSVCAHACVFLKVSILISPKKARKAPVQKESCHHSTPRWDYKLYSCIWIIATHSGQKKDKRVIRRRNKLTQKPTTRASKEREQNKVPTSKPQRDTKSRTSWSNKITSWKEHNARLQLQLLKKSRFSTQQG